MIGYARHIEAVARALQGEPNKHLSNGKKLRFGARGSLSVDCDKGVWKDFETDEGGGVLDLIKREKSLANGAAVDWLRDELGIQLDEPKAKRQKQARGRIVATYDYVDEHSEVLFQAVRYEPKRFNQRRPGGKDGWIWSLGDIRRVLYHLPELLAADPAEPVFVCEGEKDVDRLRSLGLVATTSPEGAGKWGKVDPAARAVLTGRHVVALTDNDDPGRRHTAQIVRDLSGKAASVRVLELAGLPEHGDVINWLDAGGTAEELRRLAAEAPEAQPGSERRPSPEADAPSDWRAALAAAIAEINRDHFVTWAGARAVLVRVKYDEEFKRTRHLVARSADVSLYYANRPMKVGEKDNGGDTYKGLGSIWLHHPDRRTYERMVLMPKGDVPAGAYNLWRGFGVEPQAGEWLTIKAHLEQIICAGDPASFHYLIRWLAYCVQHPELQAEVAVVLRGIKGAGKGLVGRMLKRLFRDHSAHIANPRHLTGNFNAHLMDALFVYADEVFCTGDRIHEAVLNTLITEETIPIEPKGVDLFEVPNRIKLLISSNKEWVVPVSADERRFFMLDVSEARAGDLDYFEQLAAAIDGTELPAFLTHLLALDLTGWKIRAVPNTKALNSQKLLGADITTKFVHTCLIDGCIGGTFGGWPVEIEKEKFRHHLSEFAQMHGDERKVPYEGQLTKKLQDLVGFKRHRRRFTKLEKAQDRTVELWWRGYVLLSLDLTRAAFLKAMKIDPNQYDWDDPVLEEHAEGA